MHCQKDLKLSKIVTQNVPLCTTGGPIQMRMDNIASDYLFWVYSSKQIAGFVSGIGAGSSWNPSGVGIKQIEEE